MISYFEFKLSSPKSGPGAPQLVQLYAVKDLARESARPWRQTAISSEVCDIPLATDLAASAKIALRRDVICITDGGH